MTDRPENLPLIRSRRVRDHAKGQPCTARFPGICRGRRDTVVLAHFRDGHKGMAIKASDLSGGYLCFECHAYLDEGHGHRPVLTDAELYQGMLQAIQETVGILARDGILFVPVDAAPPKTVKPRKPRDRRQAIPQRADPWAGPKQSIRARKDAWPPKGSRPLGGRKAAPKEAT